MKLRLLLLVLCLCQMAAGAQASPITFTLDSPLLTAIPGGTASFAGTLTETGGTTTFLNGDTVTATLPVDDSPFFVNFPLSLGPLATFHAVMFTVTVPGAT